MSVGHIKGWGNWEDKIGETEQREEYNCDRTGNQIKDTRRVEWFIMILLAGLFVIIAGIGMFQYVNRARRMANVSNVNSIRSAVINSYTLHESELRKQFGTGAVNFYLSPAPETVPDDHNGAILRSEVDALLASCGIYRARLGNLNEQMEEIEEALEETGARTEDTGWVYEAVQKEGIFRIRFWADRKQYEKNPEKPDCSFTTSGPSDSCLAAQQGAYE